MPCTLLLAASPSTSSREGSVGDMLSVVAMVMADRTACCLTIHQHQAGESPCAKIEHWLANLGTVPSD